MDSTDVVCHWGDWNWIFAKKMGNAWCPLMPILLTLTLESIFWVGGMIIGLIIELISKHFPAEELWTLLGLPIAIAFYALLFTRYSICSLQLHLLQLCYAAINLA